MTTTTTIPLNIIRHLTIRHCRLNHRLIRHHLLLPRRAPLGAMERPKNTNHLIVQRTRASNITKRRFRLRDDDNISPLLPSRYASSRFDRHDDPLYVPSPNKQFSSASYRQRNNNKSNVIAKPTSANNKPSGGPETLLVPFTSKLEHLLQSEDDLVASALSSVSEKQQSRLSNSDGKRRGSQSKRDNHNNNGHNNNNRRWYQKCFCCCCSHGEPWGMWRWINTAIGVIVLILLIAFFIWCITWTFGWFASIFSYGNNIFVVTDRYGYNARLFQSTIPCLSTAAQRKAYHDTIITIVSTENVKERLNATTANRACLKMLRPPKEDMTSTGNVKYSRQRETAFAFYVCSFSSFEEFQDLVAETITPYDGRMAQDLVSTVYRISNRPDTTVTTTTTTDTNTITAISNDLVVQQPAR